MIKKSNLFILLVLLLIFVSVFLLWWFGKETIKKPPEVIKKPPEITLEKEIELLPQKADVFGIEPITTFLLRAKIPLSLNEIKEGLKISPALAFEVNPVREGVSNGVKSLDGQTSFEILPEGNLKTGEIYQFSFPLEEEELKWAFEVKSPFAVISTTPRDQANQVPLNAGIEITFNRQGFLDPENFFEIQPKIKGRLEEEGNTLIFIPSQSLKETTVYQVKIKRGLSLKDSKDILENDFIFVFETAREIGEGYFSFGSDFVEVLPKTEPALRVHFYGGIEPEKGDFNLYRFSNLEDFLESYKSGFQDWTLYQRKVKFDPSKKIFTFKPRVFKEDYGAILVIPQPLEEGYYLLEADIEGAKDFSWIVSSPIANYFAKTTENSFFWLFDFPAKRPLDNAKISFFGQKEKLFADENGFVDFETPTYLNEEKLDFLIIEKEGYLSKPIPTASGSWDDYYFDYLATDRTLYRTSDTLYFWGAVKGRKEDLAQKKLKVTFSKDCFLDEEPLFQKEVIISNYGTISGDFSFKNLPPGFYSLCLYFGNEQISSTFFEVGIFSKPLFQVKIIPERKAIFLGEEARFNVKAEFFDGTPLKGENLRYKTYFKKETQEGQIKLNEDGKGEIILKPQYSGSTAETYWPSPLEVTIWPALFEEGEIEGRARIDVFGPRIEIRTFNEYDKNKVKVTAKLNEVNLEAKNGYIGMPVANYPLDIEVKEITYKKIKTGQRYDYIEKRFYETYSYERVEKTIEKFSQKTDKDGNLFLERELDKEKDHLFIFRGKDNEGNEFETEDYLNISFYNYFDLFGIHLETSNEKEGYEIGEKIDLIVERNDGKPFSKEEKLLFFGFQNKIEKIILTASSKTEFIFEEKYIPNIRFQAVWLSDRGFQESDDLNFSFLSSQKELEIEILTDKEKYRPKETATLQIKVTKDNVLKSGEAKIAIIDEALLAISPDYFENNISRFYDDVYSWPYTIFSQYYFPESMEGGGCFLAGTKILIGQGEEKNIEDVRPGEIILTQDPENSQNLAPAIVQHTSSHLVNKYLVINNTLRVTPEHKIFLNGKWQEVGKAKIGDYLLNKEGKNIEIKKIEIKKEPAGVYNIIVGKYHTYLADNFFVHNEEKGGETRAKFPDLAFYKILELKNGSAKTSFNLPDNLTSWRIMVEAISKDYDVGRASKNISVSLPFFVDLLLNEDFYLLKDKPKVIARAFGERYNPQAGLVLFTLSIPALDYKETIQVKEGRIIFSLPSFPKEGEYEIKLEGSWQGFYDAILRKIKVKKSPLEKIELKTYTLSENLKSIEGNPEWLTHVVFLDKTKGRVYPFLKENLWHHGERIEKKIAPFLASKTLNENFNEKNDIEEPELSSYKANNGFALLPWGGDNVFVSAMIANLSKEIFFKYGSLDYFSKIIESKARSNLDKSISFFGLASLGEKVLAKINVFEKYNELGPEEKIYLSLARALLGDHEKAEETYLKEIRPHIVLKGDEFFLDIEDLDKRIKLSGLLASLRAILGENDHFGLGNYLFTYTPKKDLDILESLLYAKNLLENYALKEEASFDYKIGKKEGSVDLSKGRIFQMTLLAEELSSLSFSNIKGEIQLQSWFLREAQKEELKKSKDIYISKTFLLSKKEGIEEIKPNEKGLIELKEGDLILIELNPNFSSRATGGSYTITDWLPAGLKPMVKSFEKEAWQETRECHPIWHPTFFEGNKVSFWWSKEFDQLRDCFDGSLRYYARVITPGIYNVPPALLQSTKAVDEITTSEEYLIEIKQ